jgi:hypothetical protein
MFLKTDISNVDCLLVGIYAFNQNLRHIIGINFN